VFLLKLCPHYLQNTACCTVLYNPERVVGTALALGLSLSSCERWATPPKDFGSWSPHLPACTARV